ncbi:HNH endonuclease [Cereibacter sphaeroides]|uniref:RNA-guided endonuclease IscB n=1 Tax=Cereibacter sphaeroides TaxID=1063 RepID=UPI001F2D277D|nr:RNA-guided endonuclease IscB [Cereibacter sphaeroides]MCE6957869.1 HNH endonuclease [Cereibacter sphaeroides]MCE6971838.1 HNH endonuclease [Cereibacter sphaeroides]
MAVFVLDKRKKPLMPCSEKRARQLLERGRAVVHRMYPFTIRLRDRVGGALQPLEVRIDPGSKSTGVAVVRKDAETDTVLHLAQIDHRGAKIRKDLQARAAFRRRRRGANLRYRAPRFDNRRRSDGWLAPSLQHRVDTTVSDVAKLRRLAPVASIAQELVRFDMQALETPEISGVEYQQGALAGYEVREYLLEKWGRCCAYCGAEGVPLQVEHIRARALGGSNRVSNLTLACGPCNQAKGAQPVEVFLARDPARLARLLAQAKRPLRDAAAVNSTRWALKTALEARFGPVRVFSGGRTKWNRSRLGVPKSHAIDAACVGEVEALRGWDAPTLVLRCTGRGSHCRTRLDRFGFPRGVLTRSKTAFGFRTGDMVRAEVPAGARAGAHVGRVAIRATGSFNIQTAAGVVQGVSHRHCRLLQRGDGYGYSFLARSA